MKSIDEIILKPAYWQLDDYNKAKTQLYEMMKEVIGPDPENDPSNGRYNLWHEQFARLDAVFGKGKRL